MSLVDYASSSDDDDDVPERGEVHENKPEDVQKDAPEHQRLGSSSNQKLESTAHLSEPSIEKLPDVSLLLSSPAISSNLMSVSDHSSRVAAAMAENASRKRDSNGLASSLPRSKVPRGTLPHSRNLPDIGAGMLVPPQLSGRSNVVTEDISKLFVKKLADPSSQ